MLIDSTSHISARSVAENLIANQATRTIILNFLADSIIKVHKQGERAGTWSVTLGASGEFIRMNVGRIEVFAVYTDTVRIIVNFVKLPNTDAMQLQSLGGEPMKGKPVYVSVPCSQMWLFVIDDFPTVIPIIRNAYEYLLEEAASSVKWRTGYYKKHSAGVLEYLWQETGRSIPNPNYLRPSKVLLRR